MTNIRRQINKIIFMSSWTNWSKKRDNTSTNNKNFSTCGNNSRKSKSNCL